MRKLLVFSSVLEKSTGIALMFLTSLLVNLFFGIEPNDAINAVGRLGGIALICFGLVCFPYKNISANIKQSPAFRVMLVFNFIVAVYLVYLKFGAGFDGTILLPAAVLHTIITVYYVALILKKGNA